MKKFSTLKVIVLLLVFSFFTATFLYLIATPKQVSAYTALVNRLKGKILLRVEHKGEAWYVNPDNGQRYFMGTPTAAYNLMKSLGLGITDDDLFTIPKAPGYRDVIFGNNPSNLEVLSLNHLAFDIPNNYTVEYLNNAMTFIPPNPTPPTKYFAIKVKNQTRQDYVNEYNNPSTGSAINLTTTMEIGGVTAYKYSGTNALSNVDLILIPYGNELYILDLTGYTNSEDINGIIQSIWFI